MKLVNIGCGTVYHPAWINLDTAPVAPEVQRCDARGGLPFPDGSVDAVYHSHMLEHLDAASARAFLVECHRVLRPGGVLRVAVPDLEGIAQAYLRELTAARAGADRTLYEWSRMELTDQAARSQSGGEMAVYLRDLNPAQLAQIRTRAGNEVDSARLNATALQRWQRLTAGKFWFRLRREAARAFVWLLGGAQMKTALDEGWFRQGGEIHRVMYDQFSLGELLLNCGFRDPQAVSAFESGIPGYADYRLDAIDGTVRKPDSLFMEAIRR